MLADDLLAAVRATAAREMLVIGDPMEYPPGLSGWRATVILQCIVGPDGRVRPETIRSVHPPPDYPWRSQQQREVFMEFMNTVKSTIPRWRYRPAEVAGCRVPQLAEQRFNFDRQP